jgi:hypothetical protein
MSVQDGGPAFPQPPVESTPGGAPWGLGADGMSLRDYFAGQALVGLIAKAYGSDGTPDAYDAADYAYHAADAMLDERRK